MRKWTQFAAAVALALGCVGCDQATKHVAEASLAGMPRTSFLHDVVRFELAHNPGAFLSLGAGLPESLRGPLFLYGPPLLLVAVALAVVRMSRLTTIHIVGLALLFGGGAGNLIDRLTHDGAVIDFMSLGVGPLRTGIFNVADVQILAGALLFALAGRGAVEPASRD